MTSTPFEPTPPGITGYSLPGGSTPGSNWAAQIQASRPGATTAQASVTDPLMAPVYLGAGTRGTTDLTPQGFGSELPDRPADAIRTIDDLLSEFERMERREQARLVLLLTIGGFAGGVSLEDAPEAARDMTLNEALEAYNELLMDAAGRYSRGQNITPEELLEQAVAYRLPRGAKWDGSYGQLVDILGENDISVGSGLSGDEDLSGTHKYTSTSTSVDRDVMDPNDAMALTRAMLQRELGRDPTKGEFEDFIGAIQYAQRVNPSRTTTRTTRTDTTDSEGELVDTNTHTSSSTRAGITSAGLEDIALRKARANPDWAEWQAVGTYAPALFQALGATVPGV